MTDDLKKELFEEMEQRLFQAEKDLKELKKMKKRIKKMGENMRKLSQYYHSDWLEDRDMYENKDTEKYYQMMGEDAIWSVEQEHFQNKLQLLKVLANQLNRDF